MFNKQKLKEYFFENPTIKKRLRELERETKLPFPSISRYTKELLKENFLTTLIIGNTIFYQANRMDQKYKLEKQFYNKLKLIDSGLIDYLSNYTDIIILFGSYEEGEDIETSDIDIYIETNSSVNIDDYSKILRKPIQLFRNKKLNQLKNKNLANNILNGTVLKGFVEVY